MVSPQNANTTSDSSDNFVFFMCMTIAAVILYLMRPNSLRRRNDGLNKPADNVSPIIGDCLKCNCTKKLYNFSHLLFTSGRLVERSSTADGKLMRLQNEVIDVPRKIHTAHTIQGKMYVKILLNFYTWNELYTGYKNSNDKICNQNCENYRKLLSYNFWNRWKI